MQVISSWLNLQARTSEIPAVKAALLEADSKVQAMALVHQMLYQGHDLSMVSLADYLRELSDQLLDAQGAGDRGIVAEFDMESVHVDFETALPCGFIVSELITNSLKHAFPEGRGGKIRIALHRIEAGQIALRFADDGIGFHADGVDGALPSSEGFGLETIKALGEGQLGGSEHFETEGGFAFSLLFRDSCPGELSRK